MIFATPGQLITALVEGFQADLEHVGLKVVKGDITLVERTEAGITEVATGAYESDGEVRAPDTEATYVLVWDEGAGGGGEEATEELRVTTSIPSVAEIPEGGVSAEEARQRSPFLNASFSDDEEDTLQGLLNVSATLVSQLTGRAIPPSTEGEAVPVGMWELAVQAVIMQTEQIYAEVGTASNAEDTIERGRLRSIAAGSWSESYFGPGEAAKAKQLSNNPTLAAILWVLCTWQKQDEWLQLWDPEHAPGYSVIEAFDYRRRPGGY